VAVVVALLQVGLEWVQDAVAAGAGEQVLDAGGVGESADGLDVQAEPAADFGS
jgi:hypothetical protein